MWASFHDWALPVTGQLLQRYGSSWETRRMLTKPHPVSILLHMHGGSALAARWRSQWLAFVPYSPFCNVMMWCLKLLWQYYFFFSEFRVLSWKSNSTKSYPKRPDTFPPPPKQKPKCPTTLNGFALLPINPNNNPVSEKQYVNNIIVRSLSSSALCSLFSKNQGSTKSAQSTEFSWWAATSVIWTNYTEDKG